LHRMKGFLFSMETMAPDRSPESRLTDLGPSYGEVLPSLKPLCYMFTLGEASAPDPYKD
jgi:hypothetical protein